MTEEPASRVRARAVREFARELEEALDRYPGSVPRMAEKAARYLRTYAADLEWIADLPEEVRRGHR
jgi:hypothetical protein